MLLQTQLTHQSPVVTVPGQCCATPPRRLHLLQHHHLKPPSLAEPPFVQYDTAEALQEEHRAHFLAWKAAGGSGVQPPAPQLISFQSTPTYTLGRRQDELTPAQAERLAQPLTVSLLRSSRSSRSSHEGASRISYTPHIKKTNRGGLTTYHGPGQLVFWPVIDMHSPLYARFGVASYARHLEATTQRLLWDLFALQTYTNPDEPGVWAKSSRDGGQEQQPERKIAALGVHHRRYVTALGVALNIHLPVSGHDESQNPWARFVPCGLQGKLVTSVAAERTALREDGGGGGGGGGGAWDMDDLAAQWASRFEEGLLHVEKRVV